MNYKIEKSRAGEKYYIVLVWAHPTTGRTMDTSAYPEGFDSLDDAVNMLNRMQGGNPAAPMRAGSTGPK